jgi:hypothetical protein
MQAMCVLTELQFAKEHSGRLDKGLKIFQHNLEIARTSAASITRIERLTLMTCYLFLANASFTSRSL